MPKGRPKGSKNKEVKEEKVTDDGFYKGYDINWLRKLGHEHPDFHLVAEYDAKSLKK